MKKQTGGGRFDPEEEQVYFLAGATWEALAAVHRWNLVAINDLDDRALPFVRSVLDAGNHVLLDSGIFWLTNRHMANHPGVSMDEALALAPSDIDGFDWLLDRYIALVSDLEPDLWGYIELDQGGAINKRKTRASLEAMGLHPIPVYHPLNDGWDYFDELCEQYDRICFGNIVQASYPLRRHLLATLWERRRRHPGVWVHVLGMTQNAVTTVYPPSSCDSSSLAYMVRFGVQNVPGPSAMNATFGRYPQAFNYDPAAHRDDGGGHTSALTLGAADSTLFQTNLRRQARDLRAVFGEAAMLPEPDPKEGVRS